jgi:glycosyltransferase involved in cell wall biosynthesis
MPALSVIVTSYNIENYLEACLQSVLEQSLSDIEVIVVDDGSTDATPDMIASFAARDARFIPVLLPENSPGSLGTAANAGLDRATAPYVGIADGDDYYEPTMFEKLLVAAKAADGELVMCQYLEIDETTGKYRHPAELSRWARLNGTTFRLNVERRKQFLRFISVPWRKLYRRELLEQHSIRFPVVDFFYEDNPFHWFSIISAASLVVVPEVLCYHRVGRPGQTMVAADAGLFKIFQHHDIIRAWLVERGLDRTYSSSLVGWVVSQLEWVARRSPPALHRELFDAVAPIIAEYEEVTVRTALREGEKGVSTARLAEALVRRDFRAFSGALELRPGAVGLVDKTRYHLRHSGVRQTARIAMRYSAQRYGRLTRKVRILRGPREMITSRDVMFGLAVVQRQLATIERVLRELQADGQDAGLDQSLEIAQRELHVLTGGSDDAETRAVVRWDR